MRISKFDKIIGAKIQKRRIDLNLSQLELGNRVEMSRASIANIERGGQAITVEKLYMLAEALNIKPISLLPELKKPNHNNVPQKTKNVLDELMKELEDA